LVLRKKDKDTVYFASFIRKEEENVPHKLNV